jgi:hypothetical protein
MENPFWSGRRWLGRLSFSFLIVSLWLIWLGYHGVHDRTMSQGRVTLCYIAAFMAFSLFLMGTRERHRGDGDP